MAFNFPNHPVLGDTFQAPNGPTYFWDGVVWRFWSAAVEASVMSRLPLLEKIARANMRRRNLLK